jgi:anti-sigma B factor antagonist
VPPVIEFQLLLSEPEDGILVLNLSGEVDMATVGPLRQATKAALASGDYKTLVFDLTHLTFIDSTALHVLAETNRGMKRAGGGTKIVCDSGNLLKVFELTGLDRVFTIVPERAAALPLAA